MKQSRPHDRLENLLTGFMPWKFSNRSLIGTMGIALLAACAFVSLSGCGGEEEQSVIQAPTQPAQPVQQPEVVTPSQQEPPTTDNKTEEPTTPPKEKEPTTPPEEEKPKRPEEVSQWKEEDYLSAKKERDPKLTDALEVFLEQIPDKDQAAALLVKLLKIDPPEEKKDSEQSSSQDTRPIQMNTPQCQKGVELLGKLETDASAKILSDLMEGKIKIPLQIRILYLAGFNIFKTSNFAPYHEILYRICTDPEYFVKQNDAGSSFYTPMQLRLQALGIVRDAPSSQVRTKLALYLDNPSVTQRVAQSIEEILVANESENLQAQLILFAGKHTSPSRKDELSKKFLALSSEGLTKLLGVSKSAAGGRPLRPTATAKSNNIKYQDFCQKFWHPKAVELLTARLEKSKELRDSATELALLATIPLQSARASINKLLVDKITEGNAPWNRAGLDSEKQISDPAHYITVLQRISPEDNVSDDGAGRVANTWAGSAENMLDAWKLRMYNSALATGQKFDETSMPIRIHSGAKVTASYKIDLPTDAEKSLPGIKTAPTEVRYVRIEEDAEPLKLFSLYSRYLEDPTTKKIEDGMRLSKLLEGKTTGTPNAAKPNHFLAAEVEITVPGIQERVKRGEVRRVIIEILTIQVPTF